MIPTGKDFVDDFMVNLILDVCYGVLKEEPVND